MPRRKKQTDIEDAIKDAKPAKHGNGFDPEKTKAFVERIENLLDDIDSQKSEFMLACKAVHADIKIVYQEAKDEAGIPKKELKKVIKARELERKAEACREDLEGDEQDNYDLIRHALGDLADTPLGEAATRQTFAELAREPGGPLAPGTEAEGAPQQPTA